MKLMFALALALSASIAAGSSATAYTNTGCPVVIAHKGWHYPYWGYPENTLAAIGAAVLHGHAKWVETDPAVTRDGDFVIMHGGTTFHDLTGHSGTPANYTLYQLTRMRLRLAAGLPFTWLRIPSLAAYLARVRADHASVEAEIPANLTSAQFSTYIARLKQSGARWFARISGTSPSELAKVRAAYPGMRTDLLVAPFWPAPSSAQGSIQIDAQTGYATSGQVAALRAQGIALDIWTPDDGASILAAFSLHPQMVTTDNITLFHKLSGC